MLIGIVNSYIYNYNIFVNDGEKFIADPSEYTGFTENTSDFPYDLSTIGFSWSDGTTGHYFYFYKHFDRVGIQGVYTYEGKTEKSDIVYYNFNTGSVEVESTENGSVTETVADGKSEITAEYYYDLQGRKVDNPDNGFYIKTTVFADGTTKSTKVAINKR